MFDIALLALGMAALAALMLGLAWMAFGEYRKLFFERPAVLMSLEVFAVCAEIGGPGYLAAILAFCGAWLLMGATVVGMILIQGLLF